MKTEIAKSKNQNQIQNEETRIALGGYFLSSLLRTHAFGLRTHAFGLRTHGFGLRTYGFDLNLIILNKKYNLINN